MSSTNIGGQVITFDFKQPAKSSEFNKLLRDILPAGVYQCDFPLCVSSGINLVAVKPFTAILNIDSQKSIVLQTTEPFTVKDENNLYRTIHSWEPYIVVNYTHYDNSNNYANFEFKALEDITEYDLVIGEGVFTDDNLVDVLEPTWGQYSKLSGATFLNTKNLYIKNNLTIQSPIINLTATGNPTLPSLDPTEDTQAISKNYIDEYAIKGYTIHSGLLIDVQINSGLIANSYAKDNVFYSNNEAASDLFVTIPNTSNVSNQVFSILNTSNFNNLIIQIYSNTNYFLGGVYYNTENQITELHTQNLGDNVKIYQISDSKWCIPNYVNISEGFIDAVSSASANSNYLSNYKIESDFWLIKCAAPDQYNANSLKLNTKGMIFGGLNSSSSVLSSCNFYCKNFNIWSNLTSFSTTARMYCQGFSIYNKNYIVGGTIGDGNVQNLNDEFFYSTNSYISKTSLSVGRKMHTGFTFLGLGKGYISGGFRGDTGMASNLTTEFNSILNSWSDKNTAYTARAYPTSFILYNKSFLIGGDNPNETKFDFYIRNTDSWTSMNNLGFNSTQGACFTSKNAGFLADSYSDEEKCRMFNYLTYSWTEKSTNNLMWSTGGAGYTL